LGRKHNNYGYGSMTNADVAAIEKTLEIVATKFKHEENANFLEIGSHKGDTSRAINNKLKEIGITNYNYWAIDSYHNRKPFEECNFILGKSEEVYVDVPEKLNWVLIDGCHCSNHVMLDFLNYGFKVVENGIISFHDVVPLSQGKCDWQGHGPKNHPDFGTAVLSAFKKIDIFNNKNWKHIEHECEEERNWGGITSFEKVRIW